MALIGFDRDTEIEYIPEFMGNRSDEDPCVVFLKFVSYGKMQEYSKQINRQISAQTKGFRDGGDKVNEISLKVQKKQFTENVVKIKNYFIYKGAEKVEITDPAEFYEAADSDLIVEIIKAMESNEKLSESQVKNS